jgi:hypothetical protein
VWSTRSLSTMTLPGGCWPTGLLSIGTASQWRPGLAASLTIPSPGSVPPDKPMLILPHVCLYPAVDGDVVYFYTCTMLL